MEKIKHVAMQSPKPSTDTRRSHTEELSDFNSGSAIGCHLCHESVRNISVLLDLPQSTVSAIIVTWKRVGRTAAQPRCSR